MISLVIILSSVLISRSNSFGNMPDASQEGILKQYRSYEDVALFHYTVPPETTRATWEFASFQNDPGCQVREVHIWLQHGSYPVMAADNASFPQTMYTRRTDLHLVKTHSAYNPHDSTIYPVYNPLPGTWYVAAYLTPFEEKITQQGIHHKCRYSLGSIALWNTADNIVNIIPHNKLSLITKKHFSYYKFFIPENINSFRLILSNCTVLTEVHPSIYDKNQCIEYANIRDRALPKHVPEVGGFSNIHVNTSFTFKEKRPYRNSYYYLLVVSSATVSLDLHLEYTDCGQAGLYGEEQKHWHMTQEGLKYNISVKDKEPSKHSFQLFTVDVKLPSELEENYNLVEGDFDKDKQTNKDNDEEDELNCRSTFDFTRIDLAEEFSTNFMLQSRSWYTKWVTVFNRFPIMTRFTTVDHSDLGGTVNIQLGMDKIDDTQGQSVEIYGCLEKGREPLVINNSMVCDEESEIRIATDEPEHDTALMLIPYPEPGVWYLGLQVRCVDPDTRVQVQCWGNFRFANLMANLNLHIQPCGYRPSSYICGEYGVCVRTHRGVNMFTSCRCSAGYRGWTCDDSDEAEDSLKLVGDTLLLTLSNLFFLPAVILALYYRLYTESLIYAATMFFSTFYHTCDQEINLKHLPQTIERACQALYVSKEVLQFCDFFCAILSFWVTIISMAKLPEKVVSFLHMLGVLLVAVLVQYNRNGIQVFVVPIPLGVLILIITLIVRSVKKKRVLKANRSCALWLSLGVIFSVGAVLIFALIETTSNYQYVHSGWHVLIALSLGLCNIQTNSFDKFMIISVFLLPYCKDKGRRVKAVLPKSESISSDRSSELNEISSIDWRESGGAVTSGASTSSSSAVLSQSSSVNTVSTTSSS